MGTMRYDRTSLWGDARTTETELTQALEREQPQKAPPAAIAKPATIGALFGFASASLLAALGLRMLGLRRASTVVAQLVPAAMLVGWFVELKGRYDSAVSPMPRCDDSPRTSP